MNCLYCEECGSPNEYTLNKPKFCGNCGKPVDEKKYGDVFIGNGRTFEKEESSANIDSRKISVSVTCEEYEGGARKHTLSIPLC